MFGRALLTRFVIYLVAASLPAASASGVPPSDPPAAFKAIDSIAEREIRAHRIPGAVVLIGHQGRIVYRGTFGDRAIKPRKVPMTDDTVFDLASLTKVVATSTAVMQLVDQGKLNVDDPVARYWSAFGDHGKADITVRDLLTHYSGLRPDLDLNSQWSGVDAALERIVAEKPVAARDTRFIYSDINFEALGELVRRISGQPLAVYCADHIFKPLGMQHTGFTPSSAQRELIAPTVQLRGRLQLGQVHDTTARRMGGVAGHAGLFSTADDLAVFAQMMLDGGTGNGVRILSPLAVALMTTPQSPPGARVHRGLGWDIDSPFASSWHPRLGPRSYGHTGYTGTSLYIDPVSRTYVIILTNRVHPDGGGDARPLRAHIASLVAEVFGQGSDQLRASEQARAEYSEQNEGGADAPQSPRVETGVDVLAAQGFAPLAGRRIGLITNHSGLDANGRRTIDLLQSAHDVQMVAVFTPEHGLNGDVDKPIADGREPETGLPVFSLYGKVRRPTAAALEGMDALVFDVQDAGVRFYTYVTTMAYAMEAAANKGIPFYVLDRPDPISAAVVQGPILDDDLRSFTGYFALPVRYGMTIGELAQLFNVENRIGAELHVVRMHGYKRAAWYDETGLQWVSPSPNLRSLRAAALYPAVALLEGANVSVGRGTDTPFERIGAPWIDGRALASYLNRRGISGVSFSPVDFVPAASPFKGRRCHGIEIDLLDRRLLDAPALGVELAGALYRLYSETFRLEDTLGLIGARRVVQALKDGEDPRSIVQRWQPPLEGFVQLRARYLLY